MNRRDYYQTLEVDRSADAGQIREAYRKLAFQFHPDRNSSPGAAEKMKDLNEAYAVLSDNKKRRDYDSLKQQFGDAAYDRFRQSYSDQDIFRGSDINQIFEEMARAFGFRSFDEIFRACYGEQCQTFQFRRPGVFGRGFVFVGPGFSKEAPLRNHGHGRLTRYLLKKMGGIQWPEKGKDWQDIIVLDPLNARDGGKVRYLNRRKARELMVTIPRSTREGQQIRLKGMGGNGAGGGEPGDLYLKVQFKRTVGQRFRGLLEGLLGSPKSEGGTGKVENRKK